MIVFSLFFSFFFSLSKACMIFLNLNILYFYFNNININKIAFENVFTYNFKINK